MEPDKIIPMLSPSGKVGTLEPIYEGRGFVLKKTNRTYDFVAVFENTTDHPIMITTTELGHEIKLGTGDNNWVGLFWSEEDLYAMEEIVQGSYDVTDDD